MKAINITGLALLVLGILLSVVGWYGPLGESGGYLSIWIAYPLIIIGILLLFSIIGAGLVFLGVLIGFLSLITHIYNLIWIMYGLLAIGIIYGIVEGIIKLVKFLKKKK